MAERAMESAGLEALAIDGERKAATLSLAKGDDQLDQECAVTSATLRFLDEERQPLAGVEVTALDRNDNVRATSAANGEAVLVLRRRSDSGGRSKERLEARRAGCTTAVQSMVIGTEPVVHLGDWVLFGAAAISGRVLDESGVGVGGLTVACLDSAKWTTWAGLRRASIGRLAGTGPKVVSGPDGHFNLAGVPVGRARVVAAGDGWLAGASKELSVSAGELVDGVEIRVAEDRQAGPVLGVVLAPDGVTPVPKARLFCRSPESTRWVIANTAGQFTVPRMGAGALEILAMDPNQVLGESVLEVASQQTRDVRLVLLPAAEFTLEVRSLDGTSIERFAVDAWTSDRSVPLWSHPDQMHASGIATLRLPGAEFVIEVRSPGRHTWVAGPFDRSNVPEPLICVLEPTSSVQGIVLALGKPIAGAHVALRKEVDSYSEFNGFPLRMEIAEAAEVTTGPDGTFDLAVSAPGRYYICARAEDRASGELGPVALAPNVSFSCELALTRAGAVRVAVKSTRGDEVGGRIVGFSRGDAQAMTLRTDATGSVVAEGLTPGGWQVKLMEQEIEAPGYGVSQSSGTRGAPVDLAWNCEIVEGMTTSLTLGLEDVSADGGTLVGELTFDGEASGGWVARLQPRVAGLPTMHPFDRPGHFQASLEYPGIYDMFLVSMGGALNERSILLDEVEVHAGETSWALHLRTGSLTGTCDRPAEDAESTLYFQWQEGSRRFLSQVVPNEEGQYRLSGLPVGAGSIVRLASGKPLHTQTGVALLSVDIREGETSTLNISE